MPSLHEQIQDRVQILLLAADTDAEDRVERGRTDTPAVSDMPVINLRRGGGVFEPFSDGTDATAVEFTVEHWTSGDDWETAADELHMQSHAAIAADPELLLLARSLRCVSTDTQAGAAEVPVGRVSATYRAQALVSQRDLTRHFPT